jgi:hypothetical protein
VQLRAEADLEGADRRAALGGDRGAPREQMGAVSEGMAAAYEQNAAG